MLNSSLSINLNLSRPLPNAGPMRISNVLEPSNSPHRLEEEHFELIKVSTS